MCSYLESANGGPQFFGALSDRLTRGQSMLLEIIATADHTHTKTLCSETRERALFYLKVGTCETLDIMKCLSSGHCVRAQNLLCKEHQSSTGSGGGSNSGSGGGGGGKTTTKNMMHVIVNYMEALVNVALKHTLHFLPSSTVIVDLQLCFQCLKEIVDGPNLKNQYYLCSSTRFLGLCNRLIRHLYSSDNSSARRKGRRRSRIGLNGFDYQAHQVSLTLLASSMLDTINCACEGRTDDVVHTRISSVLQRQALTYRVEEIHRTHVGKDRSLFGAVESMKGVATSSASSIASVASVAWSSTGGVIIGGGDGGGGGGKIKNQLTIEELELLEGMHLTTLLLSLSMSNTDLQQLITRSVSSSSNNNSFIGSKSADHIAKFGNKITTQSNSPGLKHFISKIGRVEIRNLPASSENNDENDSDGDGGGSGSLLPIFFPIPEMCLKFSREELKSIFNLSLPRSVENLRKFQDSVHDLYAAMCVERQLDRLGLGSFVSGTVWSSARDVLAFFGLMGNLLNLFFLQYVEETQNQQSNSSNETATPSSMAATTLDVQLSNGYRQIGTGTTTLQFPVIQQMQKLVIVLQFLVCVFVVITRVLLTRSGHDSTIGKDTGALQSGQKTKQKSRAGRRCCCLTQTCCCVQCCTEDCYCSSKCCLGLCCAGAYCDGILLYYVIYMVSMLICLTEFKLGYIIQWIALLDVMIRNETAKNVLQSVTSPAKQLALTLFLSMIFSYFFALLGFFFFNEDYEQNECDTLRTCFLTTLNEGIRAGGGIGEYMRHVDPFMGGGGGDGSVGKSGTGGQSMDSVPYWLFRMFFDLFFFLVLNIILLNLVFGIIIDNFAERRFDRQEKNINKQQFCFVCDVSRRKFDQLGIGFAHHTQREHSYEHILFYLIYVFETPEKERSHAEKYVYQCWQGNDIGWWPNQQAASLPTQVIGEDDD